MKKGLGRGLNALLDIDGNDKDTAQAGDTRENGTAKTGASGVLEVDIRQIEPNRQQPRQHFNEDSLRELAESIKAFGVVQPLIVRDCGDHYAIVAGERRFRAARIARMEKLPVIVKDYSEMEVLQVALIENIQRQDLTPIEEATCYKRLIEDFFFTQEDIAEKIGKNRYAVSTMVRLLDLDPRVQDLVSEGRLTPSHARALLPLKDGDAQYACAEKVVEGDMNVRGAEALAAAMLKQPKPDETKPSGNDMYAQAFRHAEEELKTLFGAKVNIHHGKKKGKIEIEYYSPEELDRLLCLFKRLT